MFEEAEPLLDSVGWSTATGQQITGDLSPRRYFRLSKGSETAILMDARHDPLSTENFVKIGDWLRRTGLSAPRVLAADTAAGILLLEDFGDASMTRVLEQHPAKRDALYADAVDLIAYMQTRDRPQGLAQPPLPELIHWLDLTREWYPGDGTSFDRFSAGLETVLAELPAYEPAVSLRDFHADNLMILPRSGLMALGLLDFQDAFLTHPVFDVVSLLTDARRIVPPDLRTRMQTRYAKTTDHDMRTAFAAISLLRNTRILGVFARAIRKNGRDSYRRFLPTTYAYVVEALQHPSLAHLAQDAHRAVPNPRVFQAL